MTSPTTVACPRCRTVLARLAPGAVIAEVALGCPRCGHWARIGPPTAAAPAAAPAPDGAGPLPTVAAGPPPLPPAPSSVPWPTAGRLAGALTWIGVGLAAAGGFAMVGLGLVMTRFEPMYADLGGPLPDLTAFAVRAHLPALLALSTLGLAAAAGTGAALGKRWSRALVAVALLVPMLGGPVLLVAMYLPVFSVAGAIR
jgi:hypothetical protein